MIKIFIWEKKGAQKMSGGGGGEHQVKCKRKRRILKKKKEKKKRHCLGRKESYQPGSKGCRDGRHIITSETTYKVLTLWWMWDR